jgi:hypothetical protein
VPQVRQPAPARRGGVPGPKMVGVPDFLYAALDATAVCGVLQGKPHEVHRSHQAAQEIRGQPHDRFC